MTSRFQKEQETPQQEQEAQQITLTPHDLNNNGIYRIEKLRRIDEQNQLIKEGNDILVDLGQNLLKKIDEVNTNMKALSELTKEKSEDDDDFEEGSDEDETETPLPPKKK